MKWTMGKLGGTELIPESEIKDKASNNEVNRMEFVPGNEIKEGELYVGVTKMELPPDSETMEEELHNVVSGMELPPDNEIKEESNNAMTGMEVQANNEIMEESPKHEFDVKSSNKSFLLEPNANGGDESGTGTEEERASSIHEGAGNFPQREVPGIQTPKILWRAIKLPQVMESSHQTYWL